MNNTKEEERDRNYGSLYASRQRKPWSFYKLMLCHSVQSKNMRIPEAFARAFSNELSGVAILTVPSGESWEVALVSENDQLWFCKGWQEFMDYFTIGFAYFLLFLYEGTLRFKVHIFNPTACEIFYPRKARNWQQEEHCHSCQSTEQDSDDVDIVSDGGSSTRNDSGIESIVLDSSEDEETMSNVNNVAGDGFVGSLSVSDDMERDRNEGSMHSTEMKHCESK